MNPRAATIQIFLPSGDPRGIRIAEMTTRIVQVIEVPRSLLTEFLQMPESGQVALYFLFGKSDNEADPRVYIGQTGDLRARLAKHHKERDFWDRAAILISRTNSLTQTHALYLEWHCLQTVSQAARYQLENGNLGTRPHAPAPLAADCLEIFETCHGLLSTLGFTLFDPARKSSTEASDGEIFFCKASGANGRGQFTSDGFVVLEGSSGRSAVVPSLVGTSHSELRSTLLASGVLRLAGESVVFTKDHVFSTPSSAAVALMGRTANGWIDWKTSDGRTLDAVKRQSIVSNSE